MLVLGRRWVRWLATSQTPFILICKTESLLFATASLTSSREAILSHDRVTAAFHKFFRFLHPLPALAFLHRASLLQLYRHGRADQALLLAIIAITSRLPGVDAEEAALGARCANLSEDIIMKDIRRPSILKAQALLLIVRYRMWTGSSSSAFILMATLARQAFALRLNYESRRHTFLVQESRRRLMWAVYIVDNMLSGGLHEFTLCHSDVMHIRLPSHESNFELDIEIEMEFLRSDPNSTEDSKAGLHGSYVKMLDIRYSVLRYVMLRREIFSC